MSDSYELYHLGIESKDVPGAVVLAESEFHDTFSALEWQGRELARRREYTTSLLTSEGVSVLSCIGGVGSPAVAIAAEELFRAGAVRALSLNVCRCARCETGEPSHGPIVVIGAIRDERTSLDYAPLEYPAVPTHALAFALLRDLKGAEHAIVRTVDVLPRWTGQDSRPEDGLVDLSSSALMVVAAASGVESVSVLVPPNSVADASLVGAILTSFALSGSASEPAP